MCCYCCCEAYNISTINNKLALSTASTHYDNRRWSTSYTTATDTSEPSTFGNTCPVRRVTSVPVGRGNFSAVAAVHVILERAQSCANGRRLVDSVVRCWAITIFALPRRTRRRARRTRMMGTFLNKPITEKDSLDVQDDRSACGASAMQGWRAKQEDAHVCILDFDQDISLFGVFDGHGGPEVAQYAAEILPSFIKNELFENGDYENALIKAFLDFDDSLTKPLALRRLRALRLKNVKSEESGEKIFTWIVNLFDKGVEDDEKLVKTESAGNSSGCTAVVSLLVKNKLYVANAGDSRCVISINGVANDMSKDHKPTDELEFKRILAAGGRVSSSGRINNGLNLSRSFGDHLYKKNSLFSSTEQIITALPDVQTIDLEPESDNFIVLACDGIWNTLCSQKVVDFISNRIHCPDIKLSYICEEMFEVCLAPNIANPGIGCDNMTCIIVKLKHHQN